MVQRQRPSLARALRIAGYSWPLYAGAIVGIVAGVVLACLPVVPWPLRWLGGIAALVAAWYAVASFSAFHWMFDRSELLEGRWLIEEVGPEPKRWVQINAGLEETTLPMHQVFPAAQGKSLDLFDPAVMTEHAVTRARQQRGDVASIPIQPDALPIDDAWAEAVVVTLAAHEIRDSQKRGRFFQEMQRIVSLSGKVVVVEHLRDLPAALAFGPGIFHFYPHSEWLRLGAQAKLKLERERRITPFVRVFIFGRTQAAQIDPTNDPT